MIRRMFQRRGTEAEWAAANPVLSAGEIGVAYDPAASPTVNLRFKIGDGVAAWLSLPWCGVGAIPDPGHNAIAYWNEVSQEYRLAAIGAGLALSGDTLSSSGGVSDGDKGDITVSGGGTVWTLDTAQPNAHTWALTQTFTLAPIFTDQSGTRTALGLGSVTNDAQTKAAIVPNTAPSAGQLLVGNAGGTAYAPVAASGDVTVASTGAVTIASAAVTYAKMQDVTATSRVLGRRSAGSGDVEECTLSQVLDFIGSAAQGDILYRSGSAWARLGAGTSGQALVTGGAGADPAWGTVGSGAGGAMTYIGSATVTGSAATTLSISGLNLDVDTRYEISFEGANATGSASTLSLYFNSDTTAANYDVESVVFNGATTTPARANSSVFGQMAATSGTGSFDFVLTKGQDAKPGARILGREDITTATRARVATVMWRTASTNVTGITITASVANSLAVGTIIRVWKTSP